MVISEKYISKKRVGDKACIEAFNQGVLVESFGSHEEGICESKMVLCGYPFPRIQEYVLIEKISYLFLLFGSTGFR